MTVKPMRYLLVMFLTLSLSQSTLGQLMDPMNIGQPPRQHMRWLDCKTTPDKQRTWLLTGTIGALYAGSMTWLYTQWYKDYPLGDFHFFNDNQEWESMDKFAHAWDAYSISKPVAQTFRWAGYDERKSAYYGAGVAFLFQTTVEVFDGFSEEWGFSMGDMAANTAGTALFLGQELLWNEQRIVLKYSFHMTPYAQYRPDVLGQTVPERLLKDYNGMTFWASINPKRFFRNPETSNFPAWLSLAVGFGAEGMTGGEYNPSEVNGTGIPSFERYRQYYLGLDIDLARIRTRSRLLTDIFHLINIVHIPAPALEMAPGHRPRWHALYF